MTFIDVRPDEVAGAGRATAATASSWDSWAGRAESLLRDAAEGTQDEVMNAGFVEYLSSWNPTLKNAASQACDLGVNAASAAGSVATGDNTAAHQLQTFGAAVEQTASSVRRPINAG